MFVTNELFCTQVREVGGSGGWLNPTYVYAKDGSRARSIAPPTTLVGYSFNPPAVGGHGIVTGIKVVLGSSYYEPQSDSVVVSIYDGSNNIVGVSKNTTVGATPSDIILGGENDLWGATQDTIKNLISNNTLGIGVLRQLLNRALNIDSISIIIYITYPSYNIKTSLNANQYCNEVDGACKLSQHLGFKVSGFSDIRDNLIYSYHLFSTIYSGGTISNKDDVFDLSGIIFSKEKVLSPPLTGIKIIKSSNLPVRSFIAKYKFDNSSYISLNGGKRVMATNGEILLVDTIGNWVVLQVNTHSLMQESIAISYIYGVDSYNIPLFNYEPPFSSLMFEDIARQVYGNAELGIILRQLFVNDFQLAQSVILPDKSQLVKLPVSPESHIWERELNGDALIEDRKDE